MVSHNPVKLVAIDTLLVEMFLVCHIVLKDNVFKGPCDFMGGSPSLLSYHLAKFGGHRHYGKEDLMFLVVEEEDSRCSLFNTSLLVISKGHSMKVYNLSY